MVTIRRESAGRNVGERESRPVARVTLDNNYTFVKDTFAPETGREPMSAAKFAPEIEYGETIEAGTVRITPKMDAEDLAPSYRAEPEVMREKPQEKPVGKTKTMIAVYIMLAVVLAVVVFVTGFAISGASAEVAEAESRLNALNASITAQQTRIETLLDTETDGNGSYKEGSIGYKAVHELGMEAIDEGTVQEITLIPLNEQAEYEGPTNWFDRFCAFFSRIFG